MNQWLDRTMLRGPHLALATSQKGLRKLLRDLKMAEDSVPWDLAHSVAAACRFFRRGDGDGPPDLVIVLIPPGLKRREAALRLAHEAVHIYQAWCERVGEVRESRVTEAEAYCIENLSRTLLKAYHRARR